MKIGLIQIDGELSNLALMKLSAWHKKQGDTVFLIKPITISRTLINFDKVYVSCIFEENQQKAITISKQYPNSELGGIGANSVKLPDEIEHIMPDYETFNCDYSMGFTTRGCIRACYFCKVRGHEGYIRENCDIYEFWNRKHRKIILMDNNILALPEHFKKIASQLKENKLTVDFNQGLDHRLLTPEICQILLGLKHEHEIRFAFDDISSEPTVMEAIKMMKEAGMKDWKARWYLYIGVKDTFETVYKRMELLRKEKQAVYVMRDRKVYDNPEFIALASWGNTMGAFKMGSIEGLLEKSERFKSYGKILEKHKSIFNRKEAGR